VINLKKWREEDVGLRVNAFLEQNRKDVIFWDQDGLNAILHNRWLSLDDKYNNIITQNEFENIFKHPFALEEYFNHNLIIHFVSDLKPWLYANQDPRRHKYLWYLAQGPWRGQPFPDKNLWTSFKKGVLERMPRQLSRKIVYVVRYVQGKS